MQHRVQLYNISIDQALQILQEIRGLGLRQGSDFEWSWHKNTFDVSGWDLIDPQHATFSFSDAAIATFIELKYQRP